MDRRKFLLGLGATSAGGATLIGSGAFTQVAADREIAVDVAGDAEAFLQLLPTDHSSLSESEQAANGAYAMLDNGLLTLDFSSENDSVDGGGEGLNQNAITVAREVFLVRNQGTQGVDLVLAPGHESAGTVLFPQNDVLFAILPDGENVGEPVSLDVGEEQRFSVLATTNSDFDEPPINDTISFIAEADPA